MLPELKIPRLPRLNLAGVPQHVVQRGNNCESITLTLMIDTKSTFEWSDLVTLLAQLGYEKQERAGSRVRFYNIETQHMIHLHKPHPESHVKGGALKSVKEALRQEGYL